MERVKDEHFEEFLSGPLAEFLPLSTLTLATSGPNGEPHAAPVYFAASHNNSLTPKAPLRLYFFSDIKSQHAQDVARTPLSAVALYPECQGWRDIRGLQMHGETLQVPPGAEWDQAWEVYQVKFPFVTAFKAVVARNILYGFTPHWIRLVDNRRGFGFKVEWKRDEH